MKIQNRKYDDKCYLIHIDNNYISMSSTNLMNHKIVKLNKLNLTNMNLTYYRYGFEK